MIARDAKFIYIFGENINGYKLCEGQFDNIQSKN